MNKKIIILSGPSGVGKNTIIEHVLDSFPKVTKIITATTRSPRPLETDGIDKYFLSEHEFKQKIEEQAFAEYEEVFPGVWYGTLFAELERVIRSDSVGIMDVDVNGALNIKQAYPDNVMLIFVRTSTLSILEERLRLRMTDNEESIRDRLNRAEYELTKEKLYDVTIVNDSLIESFEQAEELLNSVFHPNVEG